jgi:hypothetical protein
MSEDNESRINKATQSVRDLYRIAIICEGVGTCKWDACVRQQHHGTCRSSGPTCGICERPKAEVSETDPLTGLGKTFPFRS